MKADLHIHSDMSDSTLSAGGIIRQAKLRDIEVLSITDHDTPRGQDENKEIAAEAGVSYIRGIEISAYDKREGVSVHILGYGYENDSLLEDFCSILNKRRAEAGINMAEKIISIGYEITIEDVLQYSKSGIIYRPHITHALFERGYMKGTVNELFDEWFAKDGPAYFPFEYADPFEAIAVVKQAGGLAVLAHPAYDKNWACIPLLAAAGLDGIEVYHPAHSNEEKAALLAISDGYKLFATSGSDFHGMYARDPVPIGYGCESARDEMLALASKP